MRSLRNAARKVAVFHLPCGTLSTRCCGAEPSRRAVLNVGLGPGLADEDEPRNIYWRFACPANALCGAMMSARSRPP